MLANTRSQICHPEQEGEATVPTEMEKNKGWMIVAGWAKVAKGGQVPYAQAAAPGRPGCAASQPAKHGCFTTGLGPVAAKGLTVAGTAA